jgi:serine/threonine protein kinase
MPKSSWIGKKLSNRYVIEEMLGQGGMSAVYKATDPNLKRVVAVKIIHPHLSNDADFVKRFEEEATAVAQLRNPGIIQVFDFNKDDDVYYMVLEFVPGETIEEHLKRLTKDGRRLSITSAIEYVAEVCDALDYAHQRGMIHRDIKPANLMLNIMGQVILMDFGIAKIVGGQRHTATGAVVGTAMYMSPEQIKGTHADRRTDIYSLGVTLFEMVSGRPPFEADSAMTLMMMHINDPVPNLKSLNPDVPDDLIAVINKALAKDPNARYQTAAQMAAALRNVLGRIESGVPVEAPTYGGTMLEDAPMSSANVGGTYLETPPANTVNPLGTVVENAPLPTPSTGKWQGGGTSVEHSGPMPMPPQYAPPQYAPPASTKPKFFGLSVPIIIGGLIVLACLGIGGIFLISQFIGGGLIKPTEVPVAAIVNTSIATTAPTVSGPLDTSTPSITATAADTPTATVPPGIPYARINSITINSQNRYLVVYETFTFTEVLPGTHVHFFFNTVTPENAGAPGSGPWILYGGPRPFTGYRVSDRPKAATQMCILVANPNHSVQPNSGNCMDLP